MDEKARIRSDVLSLRDLIDPVTKAAKDSRIQTRLLTLPGFRDALTVFTFASFRSEVSTFPIIEKALLLGKKVLLPCVDGEQGELVLYEIRDLLEVSPGYRGIPEPHVSVERRRDINDADLALMPGAAFDRTGNRIGYGGGYYDRLLSRLRKKIPLIALAYEEQIVDSLPAHPHDVQVHMIVTDERVVDCRRT